MLLPCSDKKTDSLCYSIKFLDLLQVNFKCIMSNVGLHILLLCYFLIQHYYFLLLHKLNNNVEQSDYTKQKVKHTWGQPISHKHFNKMAFALLHRLREDNWYGFCKSLVTKFLCPQLTCNQSVFHMWTLQQVVKTLNTKMINDLVLSTLLKGMW